MNSIKAQDVVLMTTAEVILHHNYPVEPITTKEGLRWVISQNKGGAKAKFVTHLVGLVTVNDLDQKEFQVYGGPYAGQGLGLNLTSHGEDYTALAILPWNYIKGMWILEQQEIPRISRTYGRMAIIKTMVKF